MSFSVLHSKHVKIEKVKMTRQNIFIGLPRIEKSITRCRGSPPSGGSAYGMTSPAKFGGQDARPARTHGHKRRQFLLPNHTKHLKPFE